MRKQKLSSTDQAILLARGNSEAMVARLIEIANTEVSHVGVKAAETVVRLGREETSQEKDPFGLMDFSLFNEDVDED